MKIVFSRKGFDSGSGGGPSPIVQGIPVSFPIPSGPSEPFRYADIEHPDIGPIAPLVEARSKRGARAASPAHYDPQVPGDPGIASLGQQGAAQSHLDNQGVGPGDVFVFFGLFRDFDAPRGAADAKPHHRIFGMMRTERAERVGLARGPDLWRDLGLPRPHPHAVRPCASENNTIWIGQGRLARSARPELRLTAPGASPSIWAHPTWLNDTGLSFHADPARWSDDRLRLVSRGQEFVADAAGCDQAVEWIDRLWDLLGKRPA
jgi:hypothetical protein